ncbi:hypothetical protein AB0N05_06975 [Nocardia sp. NPDC051030]|uniref:hypothetical protein n=1 Tax=Nocardia sp. NPDC051030 TaxID=3155162 RepID=UPI003432CE42
MTTTPDSEQTHPYSDVPLTLSPSTGGEPLLGVWSDLPGRPTIGHTARDWLTKYHLVAAGCGIATVAADLAHNLPSRRPRGLIPGRLSPKVVRKHLG